MVEEEAPAGAPEWVVTYGDMMSLLLTFFIMLVSMSEIKQDTGKFRAMMDALTQVFGSDFGKFGAPGTSFQKTSMYNKLSSLGTMGEGGLKRGSIKKKGPGGANNPVSRIRDGNVVTLGGPVSFEKFSAELSPELTANLDVIANVVAHKANRIEIRGHDSLEPLPENSSYRDALDLSFFRAHAVANYLIGKGIEPSRIRVSAAGDSEPRTLPRDKEVQKLNRRVDVFLIDSYIAPPRRTDRQGG